MYIIHFILLNWKYVHNVFTVLLPNFQSLVKVSLLFISSWPLSLCQRRSQKSVQSWLNFSSFQNVSKVIQTLVFNQDTKSVHFSFVGMPLCSQRLKLFPVMQQTEKISSWNGPTVHVCCFMLARASTKTFVSRVRKTAKKNFRYPKNSLAGSLVSWGITVIFDTCCFFHGRSGYSNAPQSHVIRTLPVLFRPSRNLTEQVLKSPYQFDCTYETPLRPLSGLFECCGVEAYEHSRRIQNWFMWNMTDVKGSHASLRMWVVYPFKEFLKRKMFLREVPEKLEHMFSTPFRKS